MGRRSFLLSLAAILLSAIAPIQGAAPLKVHISPWGFTHSPVDVSIDIHINQHPDNWSASLMFDSENYESESDFEVRGEAAPMYYHFERKNLPPGHYQAQVVLFRRDGANLRAFKAVSEKLEVLDRW